MALLPELQVKILEDLITSTDDLRDVANACRTSTQFRSLCADDRVWRELYLRLDPSAQLPEEISTWKRLFQSQYYAITNRKKIAKGANDMVRLLLHNVPQTSRNIMKLRRLNRTEIQRRILDMLAHPQIRYRYNTYWLVGNKDKFNWRIDLTTRDGLIPYLLNQFQFENDTELLDVQEGLITILLNILDGFDHLTQVFDQDQDDDIISFTY